MRRHFLMVLVVASVCLQTRGAELPSAADVLKKMATPPPAAGPKSDDSAVALIADIDALAEKVATMPPAEAATEWLKLFDRYAQLPHAPQVHGDFRRMQRQGAQLVSFRQLLVALPPPAAWDELARQIGARPAAKPQAEARERSLKLFAAVLTGDADARTRAGQALAEILTKGDAHNEQARHLAVAISDQKPADLVQAFEAQLNSAAMNPGNEEQINVPDLVTLVGREKAEQLLKRAIAMAGVILEIDVGEETKALARRVALAEIENLKTPHWELCQSLDSDAVKLFEALSTKFLPQQRDEAKAPATQAAGGPGLIARLLGADEVPHTPTMDDYRYQEAAPYYLLGLVIAGRTDDAIAQAKRMPAAQVTLSYAALNELENAGHTDAVQAFLHRLLSENPDLPLWDSYISLSAKVGKTGEMLALARKAAAQENLEANKRSELTRQLAKALFAGDQVDEGIALLRGSLNLTNSEEEDDSRFQAALMLARAGKLLKRDGVINDAVAAARTLTAQPEHDARQLAAVLEDAGRGTEAIEVLAEAIALQRQQERGDRIIPRSVRPYAVDLVGIYHRDGRHADVLELLQTLPYWDVADLAEIHTEQDIKEIPLGFMAAAALHDAKKDEDALRILDALLDQKGGFDPAYELMIKIVGAAAIPRLDELFSRDQFEERPLIWKGSILLSQNKTADAEKVIRQAISIDPSDGEQGKGTRMRVYAVLADILEKKGDAEQAKVYRGAVKAIRIAENADDWWEAGVLSRAIKQYEEALTHFQDAYCIQSRLALRMAEMGFTEKAEEHYRKAYELMPDSFGRMESHCFGCEGAFEGKSARKIAEEVFARLLQKDPKKPQVHYLLGYLREQQGRYGDALEPMQTAVKLDPDYLNAWKHIADLARSVHLAAELRDAATLNLLRLDPLGRHVSPDITPVRDLKTLYEVSAKSAKLRPTPPKALLPLAGSGVAKHKDVAGIIEEDIHVFVHDPRQQATRPGEVIAQTQLVGVIADILDSH